jgi:MFS family permease
VVLAALPLLAAHLTTNAFAVAAVVFAQRIPWAVVAIPAGVLVDRRNPVRAMVVADAARGAIFVAVSAVLLAGTLDLWMLYVAALSVGVFDTVFEGAAQASVPGLVTSDSCLDVANSRLTASQLATGHFIGPALGGLLYAVERVLPFAVNAVSFFGSAAMLTRVRIHVTTERAKSTWRADAREGLAFFRSSRVLPVLTGMTASLALLQAAVLAPFVLFALHDLHLSRAGYGIFLAVTATGNVAGGLAAPRLRRRLSTGPLLVLTGVVAAAAYLVVAMTSSVLVAQAAFVVEAFAVAAGTVASITFRQRHIPRPLLARVSNVFRAIIWGAIPVGALLGGILAQTVGLRAPFTVCGLAQIAIVGILARPLMKRTRAAELAASTAITAAAAEAETPAVPEPVSRTAVVQRVQRRLTSTPS